MSDLSLDTIALSIYQGMLASGTRFTLMSPKHAIDRAIEFKSLLEKAKLEEEQNVAQQNRLDKAESLFLSKGESNVL